MRSSMALLCLFLLFLGVLGDKSGKIQLKLNADGSYQVLVSNQTWFNSAPTWFAANGKADSTENKTLAIVTDPHVVNGSDALGPYQATSLMWKGASTGLSYQTTFRVYEDTPAIVFGVSFLDNTTGPFSDGALDSIANSFPGVKLEGADPSTKGYFSYGGNMCWSGMHSGNWNAKSNVPGGAQGGVPLIVFDTTSQNAALWSPFSSFMSLNQRAFTLADGSGAVGFGMVASASHIPANYNYEVIVYAGNRVTDTVMGFGTQMRKYYGKDYSGIEQDDSINYIGYWTDAGSCYWYNPGEDGNYEATLEDVIATAEGQNVPFQYLQLDSWWYYKGLQNGVKNWTVIIDPTMFPEGGLPEFQETIDLPIVAHNRYFSADTDYASINKGKYNFIVEYTGQGAGYNDYALPIDTQFWIDLMGGAQEDWRLITYEQDWLYTTYLNLVALHTNVTLGRTWLAQMNYGAQTHGLYIQYCMPFPRHILQSIEMKQVTQSRASDDYYPNNDQWQVGETSLLFHSLALSPYKDTFRTDSSNQGCSVAHGDTPEQTVVIEAMAAALSTGPIGPGDKIGKTNTSLVNKLVRKDGRILKASVPGFTIDAAYARRSGFNGPTGQLWDSWTEIDGFIWHHILATQQSETYTLTADQLVRPLSPGSTTNLVYPFDHPHVLSVFSNTTGLPIPTSTKSNPGLYHIAPLFSNGWALLGETEKFVSISVTRFRSIDVNTDGLSVVLVGVDKETVGIAFAQQQSSSYNFMTYNCTFGATGTVTLIVPGGTCMS